MKSFIIISTAAITLAAPTATLAMGGVYDFPTFYEEFTQNKDQIKPVATKLDISTTNEAAVKPTKATDKK